MSFLFDSRPYFRSIPALDLHCTFLIVRNNKNVISLAFRDNNAHLFISGLTHEEHVLNKYDRLEIYVGIKKAKDLSKNDLPFRLHSPSSKPQEDMS